MDIKLCSEDATEEVREISWFSLFSEAGQVKKATASDSILLWSE